MKKLLIGLVAVLGLSTAASAQSYAGVRLGFPAIGAQFGITNAITPNLGFRAHVGVIPFGGFGIGFRAAVDLLYTLPIQGVVGLDAYFGGGPAISFVTTAVGSGVGVGVELIGGVEYRFTPNIGAFFEVAPVINFGGGFGFGFGGAVGVNFHF